MADARLTAEWDRAAMITAKIHNVNCAKQADMIDDFRRLNPFRKQTPKKKMSLAEHRTAWEAARNAAG